MKYCVSAAEFVSTPEIDRIGTLRYSRFGLIALFGILYVGVFAMAGANLVIPNLVPLFLKGWNFSNAVIGILIGTIPAVINVMVNPVVSVASDRVRTRFGRRSPFMYIGVPGVAVTLIVMGILTWAAPALVRSITGLLTPGQLIVAVMAFLMIWFQVFSNLGLSIFYYFCTDVVPGRLIGRFMAIFMLFNSAGGFFFSYVMMPLAERYMPLVFILEGMFLLAAFLMIFLFVREGRYPVPAKKKGISGEAWRFLKECFGSRFYLLVFLGFAINDVSTLCRGFFSALYAQELGISLTEYGRILSICSLICAGLTIPLGLVIDRIKPFRVYIWGAVLIVITNTVGFLIVRDAGTFTLIVLGNAVVYTLQMASQLPSFVSLFPREQYGQFSAANAIFSTALMALFSYFGGAFIDLMGHYRYMFLWDAVFTAVGLVVLGIVYVEWRRGGDDSSGTVLEEESGSGGGRERAISL